MQRRTLVLAEAGSNHDGSASKAAELIHAAKEAGADAVKFQLVFASSLLHRMHAGFGTLARLSLTMNTHEDLWTVAKKLEIPYMATPSDIETLRYLIEMRAPYIKIASGDIMHRELIGKALESNIPTILSTGFTTEQELVELKAALPSKPFAVLHCVGAYPAQVSDYNLFDICKLANMFDCHGGLSDHTLSIILPSIAVAYGADVIEKHLTLKRDVSLPGLDHGHSLEPHEFKEMVSHIREAEQLQKHEFMVIKAGEESLRVAARRGVYFKFSYHVGEMLILPMLAFVRPYSGMHPFEAEKYIGKRLRRDVACGEPVTPDCFEV